MPAQPARSRRLAPIAALTLLALGAAVASCNLVLGLDDFKNCPQDPGCPAPDGGTGPTCTDGDKNGQETDVDCGGSSCARCADDKACDVGSDCAGGTCSSGTCHTPTCTDGEKNALETDIDCGGPACGKCADDKGCSNGSDCTSKVCAGGTCLAPACGDMVQNGDETDVDCGGATCSKCDVGEGCAADGDCKGGTCGVDGKCAATCTDGVKDGDETDVDCGGATCAGCAVTKGCATGPDCETGVCEGSVCVSSFVWAKQFGDGQDQVAGAITTDALGQSFLLTRVSGTVDFGGGPLTAPANNSIAAAKFDPNGNVAWGKIFNAQAVKAGFFYGSGASAAVVDKYGNLSFAGNVSGAADFGGGPPSGFWGNQNTFVAKLDPNGNLLWSKEFPFGTAGGIAIHVTDHIVVAGNLSSSSTDFGCGNLAASGPSATDAYVASFYSNGVCAWSKRFGNNLSNSAMSLATDSASNVIVLGNLNGTVNFGAGPVVSPTVDQAIFLAKLGFGGAAQWSKAFGPPGLPGTNNMPSAVATDSAGNIFITGYFAGSIDFGTGALTSLGESNIFLVKFDPAGDTVWSKRFGGAGHQQAFHLTVDATDSVTIAGGYDNSVDFGGGPLTSDGPTYAFVAKFDASGTHLWSRGFGSAMSSGASGVASADANHVLLAGNFLGGIDFGGGQLTTHGANDVFLAKLLVP